VNGNGQDLIHGSNPEYTWRNSEKPQNISVVAVGDPTAIHNDHFTNKYWKH
jgi:hypothetical protein